MSGDAVFAQRMEKSREKTHLDEILSKLTSSEKKHYYSLLENPELGRELKNIHTRILSLFGHSPKKISFHYGLIARFCLSSLIEADYTSASGRGSHDSIPKPDWEGMQNNLNKHLGSFKTETPMNQSRAAMSQECFQAAGGRVGKWSLTLPIGAGKTLSSLRFALEHARRHHLSRIIYVFEILGASTQENAFIRWKVNSRDGSPVEVYHDPSMYESWRRYTESKSTKRGMCYILGQTAPLAANHPARIRNAGDKAKLISSNDSSGYTYRGKFIEADEACGVSTEVTQKAHSALRWLISCQGWYDRDLVVLAWSPGLLNVPSPCGNVQEWQHYAPDQPTPNDQVIQLVKQFKKELSGGGKERLQTSLNENDMDNRVLVLSLNSASPGRMSLSSFQEFSVSDYLNNLLAWHSRASWKQHLPKDKEGNDRSYIGAPSISMIIKAAYGSKVDDKLRKHALSRLLPCVLQNLPIPPDLEKQCILQASKRHSMEWWEWEMTLGVSCSIYLYNHPQTHTSSSDIMSLDSSITDRSYLFGRLLAVAEAIEH